MVAITVSRQYGSGGRKIAEQIANELNYGFFDKSLMVEVGKEIGISETELVDFSEEDYEARSFFDMLFGGSKSVATVTARTRDGSGTEQRTTRKVDEQEAIDLVRATINAAYRRGNIVLVDRGAQHILKNEMDVFHVRIIAPDNVRRQRLVDIVGHKDYETAQIIAERDKANKEYHRRFYEADLDNPMLYDLVINTGKFSPEQAVELIVTAYKTFLQSLQPAQATG